MLGYLKSDSPGVIQPVENDWYDTGDIFRIVGNNFLKFVDRAKRIAKIAGEMVSLLAAEHFVGRVWKDDLNAVVAVYDAKKGQALVLITTKKEAHAGELLAAAKERGIAELFVPRIVLSVDSVPLLGSGKFDYPAIKKLAEAKLVE
jgi:acyl-[acyl-carrier-protein]-phospholipid O-acyltransferase/long-chain-fatty-acid--[acyl-carrier-protein] ligase